jgi:hypothetical protein
MQKVDDMFLDTNLATAIIVALIPFTVRYFWLSFSPSLVIRDCILCNVKPLLVI